MPCPIKWADHPCAMPCGSVGSYLGRVPLHKRVLALALLLISSKSVPLFEPLFPHLKEENPELDDMWGPFCP